MIRKKTDLYISLSKLKADIPPESSSEGGANTRAKTKSKKTNSSVNNVGESVVQFIITILELDGLDKFLRGVKVNVDEWIENSKESFEEFCFTFITTINLIWDSFPGLIENDGIANGTTITLDKMFEDYAKTEKLPKDNSVVRAFGFIFSLISFVENSKSAGEGEVFTKREDIIISVAKLAISIASLFLHSAVVAALIPILGGLVIDVKAYRMKDEIFVY